MVTRAEARLDLLRRGAIEAIDAAAGQARARYITVAPGQEGVYLLKAAQAEAYRAAGYPADASPWPLIALEAEARAMTPRVLADEVLWLRDAWTAKAAAIEAARLAGKRAVSEALHPGEVAAARDAAIATLSAL